MRVFVALALLGLAAPAPAQHGGHQRDALLFLVRASGDGVVPRQASAASATAAIIFSRRDGSFRYDLTYAGLEHGAPAQIVLRNFGAGGNGEDVAILCGKGTVPCPALPAARIAGSLALKAAAPLLSEFASGRIYLEIVDQGGRGQVRGQLEANSAMTASRIFLARLGPAAPGAAGEGTAVLSETSLPGDRIQVDYSVTVAGTSARPEGASLGWVARDAAPAAMRFEAKARLGGEDGVPASVRRPNSFNGSYVAERGDAKALLVTAILAAGDRSAIVAVRTDKFPQGELAGVLVPVE